jgi:hypothetical protein
MMSHRAILLSGFVIGMSFSAPAAQELNGRVNLNVVSDQGFPTFVTARASFAESDTQCAEDRGTLRISGGTLALMWPTSTEPRRPASDWHATIQPTDDETRQYRVGTSTCRVDIAVRQQVRHDESWEPLLVPRQQRPSLPLTERRELQNQFVENLLTPKDTTLASREWLDRYSAATKEMRVWRDTASGAVRMAFVFEERLQTCFEAIGDFQIRGSGVQFSFLTGLPDDLNRFVIERTDLDANRRRLYFLRGNCRFELTISQSVLRDGEWTSVPLVPITSPKD